jgi:NADH-quinone oxidoreductase subunit L
MITKPQVPLASIFILLGIVIKAAQFPLCHWLVTAMTAPTPASALLHGATLVNASIYVLLRMSPILPTKLLTILTFIGSMTAITGAYAALTQPNLKRLLAYSTISQLGYTIMAIGIQAPATALLYMLTHAFSKTCLFLCLGAFTFFMRQNSQPIYLAYRHIHRGKLAAWMSIVGIAYLLASLALLGFPGFIGVFAKEKILVTGMQWAMLHAPTTYYLSYLVPACALVSATLTFVYIGRSWLMIFTGSPLLNPTTSYAKQPRKLIPLSMQISILCLVLCCCSIPYQWLARTPSFQKLLHTFSRLLPEQNYPLLQAKANLLAYSPSIALLLGVFILYFLTKKTKVSVNNRLLRCLYKLSYQGWYLEIIHNQITRYFLLCSYLIAKIDLHLIQGCLHYLASSYILLGQYIAWLDQKFIGGSIKLIATVLQRLSKAYENLHKGHVQHYFWWTCLGIILMGIFLLVYKF